MDRFKEIRELIAKSTVPIKVEDLYKLINPDDRDVFMHLGDLTVSLQQEAQESGTQAENAEQRKIAVRKQRADRIMKELSLITELHSNVLENRRRRDDALEYVVAMGMYIGCVVRDSSS